MSLSSTVPPISLGLCCLNTVLRNPKKLPGMKRKPEPIFSSRSMIYKTLVEKGFHEAVVRSRKNLEDIIPMLEWNIKNRIRVFRLSSEIFPHISNPDIFKINAKDEDSKRGKIEMWEGRPLDAARYQSLDWCQDLLEKVGTFAKSNGIRLTFHPGQFNVLGTTNKDTLTKTRIELEIHARILDMMGMGNDSIMVIHGGGIYMTPEQRKKGPEGRIEAKYGSYPVPPVESTRGVISRWVDNFLQMPENVQRRLVLENCEKSYSLEDCLRVSDLLYARAGRKIPIVYDTHHYACYTQLHPDETQTPVRDLIQRVLDSWISRGVKPKFHISEQGSGKCGHHSDYVEIITPELLEIYHRFESKGLEIREKFQEKLEDRDGDDEDGDDEDGDDEDGDDKNSGWGPVKIDVMIEAKAKEQAILHLHGKVEYQEALGLESGSTMFNLGE